MGAEGQRRSILLTPDKIAGLRGLARSEVPPEEGDVSGRLLDGVLAAAEAALEEEPITVFTPLPGRSPEDLRQGNPEYIVVNAAGQRVLQFALACALGEERRYADAALSQVECLFDPSAWPEWQDLYHRRSLNLDADLRTGQLALSPPHSRGTPARCGGHRPPRHSALPARPCGAASLDRAPEQLDHLHRRRAGDLRHGSGTGPL